MRRRTLIAVLVLGFVGLGSGFMFASWQRAPGAEDMALQGTLWPQPRPLAGFRLQSHDGGEFGPAQMRGNWSLLFFGYTSCPDICPTTMLTLRDALEVPGAFVAARPRVILVSVDPQRDDARTLAAYVGHFGKAFVGVRGETDELDRFTRLAGAMVQRESPDADGNYDIAHSVSIFIVDPQGRLYAAVSPPYDARELAGRIAAVQRHYSRSNPEGA